MLIILVGAAPQEEGEGEGEGWGEGGREGGHGRLRLWGVGRFRCRKGKEGGFQ